MGLGLEVKAFREARNRCSSLGCRVKVDLIGRDYEYEIFEILLMLPEMKTHEHGYHADLELSDRSRG